MDNNSIGSKISPILVEIEDTIWEHEANVGTPTDFPIEGFRASIKIFMSVLMDKMWELQLDEKIEMEDRGNMALRAGEELRQFVKKYTGIDTIELYKSEL